MSKIIITGATGTAGAEALRQALLHPGISQVFVLTRRPLPAHVAPSPPSPKLTVIEHGDFLSYPPDLLQKLDGADGVIWDLGISAVGFKEKEYAVITKDYAIAAANAFATGLKRGDGKGKFVFTYLSGAGADQNGSSTLFARVKGQAEVALAEMRAKYPSFTTYSFRAGGINPIHPVPEASFVQRVVYGKALFPLIGTLYPAGINKTDALARAMIEVVLKGGSGEVEGWKGKGELGNDNVFDSSEINKLAKGSALSKSNC